MSTWREERRRDKAADAEQKRADAKAAAEAEAIRTAAMTEADREAEAQRFQQQREREQQRQEDKRRRAERRRAALSALRTWAARHVVDLLIYPIALVSFVLAAPAMADYGSEVYGSGLGVLLPGITELGMWAFAVAVQVSRTRHPERPVWSLQVGVWVFGGVAFALNALHGLATQWEHGAVMGIVAVAGVVAHQLTVASPPRSRVERADARIARQATRKVTRVRKAAVRQAVAEIDRDGTARLVYAPGRYVLGKRRRLEAAIVPGLPVESTPADEGDALDRELADLLATTGEWTTADADGVDPVAEGDEHGPVATLDHSGDQRESRVGRAPIQPRPGRSIEQLRAELRAAVEADPPRVDPTSAESIRKALRCSAARARQLRDEHGRDAR
ncbi:hypothetical protein [Saccharomonospora halophila]|uniref:hypothetical protein n=1 Tax=Saccharomonospora halophila TaxID=129922 RepID=UPI00037EC056|nr:hypothetical protein [Saccharomonospora halophila]